jgi:hypothetical protein
MKRYSIVIFLSLFTLLGSCGVDNSSKSTKSDQLSGSGGSGNNKPNGESCACTTSDVRRVANQVVNNFTMLQNELPSDMARVIRIDEVDSRDNCMWVVTYKISWPFGNTDGAHPDEYMKKRYACDGKEIYEQ